MSLILLLRCIALIDFQMLNQSCILLFTIYTKCVFTANIHVFNPLNMLLDLVCEYFLRDFASIILKNMGLFSSSGVSGDFRIHWKQRAGADRKWPSLQPAREMSSKDQKVQKKQESAHCIVWLSFTLIFKASLIHLFPL